MVHHLGRKKKKEKIKPRWLYDFMKRAASAKELVGKTLKAFFQGWWFCLTKPKLKLDTNAHFLKHFIILQLPEGKHQFGIAGTNALFIFRIRGL